MYEDTSYIVLQRVSRKDVKSSSTSSWNDLCSKSRNAGSSDSTTSQGMPLHTTRRKSQLLCMLLSSTLRLWINIPENVQIQRQGVVESVDDGWKWTAKLYVVIAAVLCGTMVVTVRQVHEYYSSNKYITINKTSDCAATIVQVCQIHPPPTAMASSELLKQIQAGRKLKHAETSDRSAPQIDSSPKDFGRSNGAPIQKAPLSSGGELGGLFAGGMPKLKPVGPSKLGTVVHLYC